MKARFDSVLRSDLEAFLRFKRALGFRYERAEVTLGHFDDHIRRVRPGRTGKVDLQNLVESWMVYPQDRKRRTLSNYLGVIRQFCLFRRRRDPRGYVPDTAWVPKCNEAVFMPHIFSPAEIRALLHQIDCSRGTRMQRDGGRLLLITLYCTGLRFGEAGRLNLADLDLRRRLLWVRESKGRSRVVPFGSDLAAEFHHYLRCRGAARLSPQEPLLLSFQGKRCSTNVISYTVRRWLRLAGLKPPRGRCGPRPYDLRHTFAVHRLSRWYRQGCEVAGRLPWLSIYMGHLNILGTETYLTTTPELLALASRRFEARFRREEAPP
jgi:integrase